MGTAAQHAGCTFTGRVRLPVAVYRATGAGRRNHTMTTKASKRQAQRANKRVARDLLGDIDALRAARERATLETAPMRGMPADDWQREVWGLTDE